MNRLLIPFFLVLLAHSGEFDFYGTLGIVSHHFSTDEHNNAYNNNHQAYGAELIYDERYCLAYLHLKNSRYKQTDIAAVGYRYNLYGPFGFYGIVGYQRGYCFDGMKAVECKEGSDNSSFSAVPMLYYRHNYFIVDLIALQNMVSLKFNLKLF